MTSLPPMEASRHCFICACSTSRSCTVSTSNSSHSLAASMQRTRCAWALATKPPPLPGGNARLVECPSWEQHRCALRALEADAPDELGVRLGAAKQGGKGVCADDRLVCLDERGCIAPVHGLHPQAHGVASERLVVHDGFHAQGAAQLRHVLVARDRHAFREQPVAGAGRVGDERRAVKVRHKLVRPEARA